jgi:FkbM family methyltransferase
MPLVFSRLQANCADLSDVSLVQAACSDCNGTTSIRLGKDGALGQMSSLSRDPGIVSNLADELIEVRTITLEKLLLDQNIPEDFGVLLIDTEGWDLTVLRGLDKISSRPRIIVTEDFAGTNEEKYAFLTRQKYQVAGNWGSDSFWVHESHSADFKLLRLPTLRLPPNWEPAAKPTGSGRVMFDRNASFGYTIAGWAWTDAGKQPVRDIVIALHGITSGNEYFFQAWRTPRPDVATVFKSSHLLMSGFRAHVDIATGMYELIVIQQADGFHTYDSIGHISLPI